MTMYDFVFIENATEYQNTNFKLKVRHIPHLQYKRLLYYKWVVSLILINCLLCKEHHDYQWEGNL